MSALNSACGRTMDDLPLFMDDAVAKAAVALEAAHGPLLVADEAVLQQGPRLHGRVLYLQLVDLAEQAQNLPLLFGADAPGQSLFQPVPTLTDLPEPPLQLCLAQGGSHTPGSQGASKSKQKGCPRDSCWLQTAQPQQMLQFPCGRNPGPSSHSSLRVAIA